MDVDRDHPIFDFRRGEVRYVSREEHARMNAEWMARIKVKNGMVYIDCDPTEDGI